MFANSANTSLFTVSIPSLEGLSVKLSSLQFDETISSADRFEVKLQASDGIIASDLLNQPCHIHWDWNGVEQHYHGTITGFGLAPESDGHSMITLICESPLYILTRTRQSRHFIYKALATIVKEVIEGSGAKLLSTQFHLASPDPQRDFTAQHDETDLSFFERILHESGWFYTLRHEESGVSLHLYDHSYSLPSLGQSIPFQPLVQGTKSGESIYEMTLEQAKSDCMGMRAGVSFTLRGHPNQEWNQSYIVVAVTHSVDEQGTQLRYQNSLRLQPAGLPFKPDFSAEDCQIHTIGISQIHSEDEAPLLNDRGEYILKSPHTDALTHPIRASTIYSGQDYGLHFPLHDQAQVMVAYLNGHPDKPVVLGSLFNEENRNVVNAENARQNRLVTQAGHTLLLDDTPAHQKILLHTSDQDHRLLLDATSDNEKIELVSETGEMRVDISKGTQFNSEDHFSLNADQSINMTAQENISFASDEADLSCEAAQDIILKAGQDISWHADQDMSIRVDGNYETTVQQSMRTDIESGDYSLTIGAGSLTQQVQQNIQLSTASGDIILKTAQASVSFMADGTLVFSAKKIILQAQSIDIHNPAETKEN